MQSCRRSLALPDRRFVISFSDHPREPTRHRVSLHHVSLSISQLLGELHSASESNLKLVTLVPASRTEGNRAGIALRRLDDPIYSQYALIPRPNRAGRSRSGMPARPEMCKKSPNGRQESANYTGSSRDEPPRSTVGEMGGVSVRSFPCVQLLPSQLPCCCCWAAAWRMPPIRRSLQRREVSF